MKPGDAEKIRESIDRIIKIVGGENVRRNERLAIAVEYLECRIDLMVRESKVDACDLIHDLWKRNEQIFGIHASSHVRSDMASMIESITGERPE